jgi:hypothetical protein
MFDLIGGLPLHPLLVHATVVLLPVMAVVTPLVAARARWRPLLKWVVVADLATFVLAFATVQAGEALQTRLIKAAGGEPVAKTHGELGHLPAVLSLALLLVAVVALFAARKGGLVMALSVVLLSVIGLASLGVIVVVGHSGATASWQQRIAGTTP